MYIFLHKELEHSNPYEKNMCLPSDINTTNNAQTDHRIHEHVDKIKKDRGADFADAPSLKN